MINLHDLYLNTVEGVLESQKLSCAHQPEGEKPAGVIWAMPKGSTKPDVLITYAFNPQHVDLRVLSRDAGRHFDMAVFYVEGVEGFLAELVKFISAGRLTHKVAA